MAQSAPAGSVLVGKQLREQEMRREYRPDVDGLRSIAILSVVLFHAKVLGLTGGFTGVDIFFVISGYLIGGHIHADLARGTFSYLTFYQRRAKRILPALYVLLAALLFVGLVLFSPFELRRLAQYAFATTASSTNFLLWLKIGYFNPEVESNPLLMTWSLGVEEQFYLLIPLMMVLLSRVRHRLVLPMISGVIVISFLLAWLTFARYPIADFYLLHSRAWELGIGVALAIIESEARRLRLREPGVLSNVAGVAGLVLAVVPFFVLTSSTPFPGPAALPSVIGSALLLASSGSLINRKLLSLPPLVFIGRVSYSWYLWHWPLLALLRMFLGTNFLPRALALSAVALSFGLAVLSYYFVERPFRSSKLPAAPLLLRYAFVSLLLLSAAGLIVKVGGLGARYPTLAAMDQIKLKFQENPCMALTGETKPRLNSFCTPPESSAPRFALWGDSHAAALAAALRAQVAKQGYVMEEYTKTSCAPLLGVSRNDTSHPAHVQECIAYSNAALKRIISEPNVKIVGLEAAWAAPLMPSEQLVPDGEKPLPTGDSDRSAKLLEASLRKTILALRSAGKQVVVFGDVPHFSIDPLWRMRTSRIPLRLKLVETFGDVPLPVDPGSTPGLNAPQVALGQQLVKDIALSIPGVSYWDIHKEMCTPDENCAYRQNDEPYYVDSSHITPAGGQKALEGWSVPVPIAPPVAVGVLSQPAEHLFK